MDRNEIRTWTFSVALLVVGSGASLAGAAAIAPAGSPFKLTWPILLGAFIVTERYAVHLEVRRDAHTLTFSEVPLTLGLVFADPGELIVARILAAVLVIAVFRRVPAVKLAYNTGHVALEAGLAVLIFHAVLGSGDPVEPRGWIAGLAAVCASNLVGAGTVSTVMKLAGAPITLRSQMAVVGVSFGAAVAGTAVALGASGALWKNSSSWVLLLLIGAALGYFFLSFVRIRERHRDLATLHGFMTSFDGMEEADAIASSMVVGLADLLRVSEVRAFVPSGEDIARVEFSSGKVATSLMRRDAVDWLSVTAAGGISARLPTPDNIGFVSVDGRLSTSRPFDDEDVQLLETAVGHVGAALENAQLVERLRDEADFRAHQALHDDVTDLPNQRALVEQLDGQLSEGTDLAMVTVRVNSLREVNETLGRAMGDEMLRQVAARLRPVGRRAWCARSATDEFTLIVPGGQEAADEFSDRIVESFKLPVLCDEVALAVIVGIGVALSPVHGADSETLLRRASLAASRTALDGTTVTTWASDRDPYDPQRLTIAADLRDAIPRGELDVHFQPQFDVVNGLVTGAEALVRWDHPRLGQLRPDQFIEAAENTGAIDALTLHVLTMAAMTGVRWRERGWDLDVAVNLSARNLTNPNFASDVAVVLERTGLPARSLTMELTESSVMTEAERALRTLRELDELGIAISIDDFGTGYSSLAHLRRLPVGEIKIDKSFVFDLTTSESDEAIVRSMIDLGHNLGLTVVVEGVETVEVRDRLHELGTDRLQGYLLSRPLSAAAFEHWVSERPIRTIVGSPKDRVVQFQHRSRRAKSAGESI